MESGKPKHLPRNVVQTATVLNTLHTQREVANADDVDSVLSWLVLKLRDQYVALPAEVYERYVRVRDATG